jgi:DNA-binding CsgD family transcriptional regulator
MTPASSIVRTTASVLSYMSENIRVNQELDHEELLKAASRMYMLNPQSIFFTCPVSHKDFFYISENCISLFGHNADHMHRVLSNPPAYITQVHGADIEDLQDCMSYIHQFVKTEATTNPQDFRCFFYYRFRHANGSYIYLQDQKATFAAADRTIYYSLLREIDPGTPFHGVKLEIYREQPYFEKVLSYKPSEAKKLTSREADLMNLIRRGLSTKEIAHHLKLSHNTVRNIKSKMFSKYNVNNSIELLNVAG